jgi:outer membrane protein TolC
MESAAELQVASIEAEAERAARSFQEGASPQVEVLRAQAALQDATARFGTATSGRRLAEHALAQAMGVDPSTIEGRGLAEVAVGGVVETLAPGPPAGTGSDLDRSPVLLRERARLEAARGRTIEERAARRPPLQLRAGVLTFGSAAGEFAAEWQAGIQLSWPLFTGGRRAAAIEQADAEFALAGESVRLREMELSQAREASDAAARDAAARAIALEASVAQWEEIARIEALALAEGTGVQTDFLQAQAALLNARAGLAGARYDEVLARASLAHTEGRLDRAWMDDMLEIVP